MKNQNQLSLQLFAERLQDRQNSLARWLKAEIRLIASPEFILGDWRATSFRRQADAGIFTFQADGNLQRTTARDGAAEMGWCIVESGPEPGESGVSPGVPGVSPGVPGVSPGVPGVSPGVPGVSPGVPGTLVAWYGNAKLKLQPRDFLGLDFPFAFFTDRNELVMTNDDTSLFYVAVRD